jgi:hypothetical protein
MIELFWHMMGTRFALALVVIVASWGALVAQENPAPAPGSLTIEEVLRLSKSGVSDDLIVAEVKKNAKAFDLNSNEIVALKKDGVSETVIKYLLDPTLPYSPPAPNAESGPAAAPAPSRKFPYDEVAEKVPPDVGVYYLATGQKFVALELKSIVPQSEPGKFGKLMHGHVMGAAAGPRASVRVNQDPLVFYARLGGKMMIDDLVLLSFKASKERRELDFGTKSGTPVFPPKTIYQFDSKEVGPGGLYKIAAPALKDGEYIFFILGSQDDKKGLLGRGYDFGVD